MGHPQLIVTTLPIILLWPAVEHILEDGVPGVIEVEGYLLLGGDDLLGQRVLLPQVVRQWLAIQLLSDRAGEGISASEQKLIAFLLYAGSLAHLLEGSLGEGGGVFLLEGEHGDGGGGEEVDLAELADEFLGEDGLGPRLVGVADLEFLGVLEEFETTTLAGPALGARFDTLGAH
jgi:hypothetical protein